jgi:hypothetical protein
MLLRKKRGKISANMKMRFSPLVGDRTFEAGTFKAVREKE